MDYKQFDKILIANRGEIALRIHRACHEMGIHTVAVHSTADAEAMHVRLANENVCIGPAAIHASYLNIPAILSAATITSVDAIHPGVGFLAENAEFAEMVEEHGFTFIGPSPQHIQLMSNKILAKKKMAELGLPTLPWSQEAVTSIETAADFAQEVGYPVLIKASCGGGGQGLRVAYNSEQLAENFLLARNEARSSFGDDTLYLEKYLTHPRHIEIQVIADVYGQVIQLGERDCSLQRRYQKVIEEAPSPALNAEQRKKIGAYVVDVIQKLQYFSVGTFEFLYEDDNFYFIEMNTRLQVEHPISEMITGIDIVREQIRIACGIPLQYTQDAVTFQGHAIECRITAENPKTLLPAPGRITAYHAPGGPWVRVDSALYDGYVVPPYYDSLISKLIVHATTRSECLMRLRRALQEYVVAGIDTLLPLHQKIIAEADFINGNYDINWLERWLETIEFKE